MIKVTILLPQFGNDGKPFDAITLQGLKNDLRAITGGYTVEQCAGVYTMHNGAIACDTLEKLWTITYLDSLPALRAYAEHVAQVLKQESIYFELEQTQVEFIRG